MTTDFGRTQRGAWSWHVAALCSVLLLIAQEGTCQGERTTISLDGRWQIARSADASPPTRYEAVAPVPGLADLAEPAFEGVGTPAEDPGYFYYRRTFKAPKILPDCELSTTGTVEFTRTRS